MTPVGMNNAAKVYSAQAGNSQATSAEANQVPKALQVEQNKVTLSDEGKALLAALSEIDKESKELEKEKDVSGKVESFTYGALGMDHPDEVKEEEDGSYSAGQYLKGAASVGALLLAVI
jgi:hypothetical protein